MRHHFEYRFDVAFIKTALRRDLLWKGYVFAGVMLALAGVMRWVNGFWEPWVTGACVFGAAFTVWRFHALLGKLARRVFELWIKQSPGGVIRYELDEDGFDVILEHSRAHHDWQGLRRAGVRV